MLVQKKLNPIYPALFSGVLFFAAWPVSPLTPFVFFAFVPLMLLSANLTKAKSFYFYAFIGMLVFNTLSTWWIWNSTDVGSIMAIIANSLLMALPLLLYHKCKKVLGNYWGSASLIVFYLAFEYLHLNWQLSWPWLTMGNVFAAQTSWVQWYEYTGAAGGSFWVLLVNVLIFHWIIYTRNKNPEEKGFKFYINWRLSFVIAAIVLPIVCSLIIGLNGIVFKERTNNVVIVQPNIDPYGKFESGSVARQIQILLSLTHEKVDSSTRLVIWPETAMSYDVTENEVLNNHAYETVKLFLQHYPKLHILTGISTYKFTDNKDQPAVRTLKDGRMVISYNTAVLLNAKNPPQFYHKSKLVPGVETIPSFLNFLSPVFEQFGGSAAGYGKSDSAIVLNAVDSIETFKCAPIICYESIYGEYVTEYVKKGANLLTIITNDGWWGNTPGHKQHLAYAKLRAIETRRWVARSANTGISAFINPYGRIMERKEWDEAASLSYQVSLKTSETFYVKYGDYIFRVALVFSVIFVLVYFIIIIKKRIK